MVEPFRETRQSQWPARTGGVVALAALVGYLLWRVLATLPPSGPWRWAAWVLVAFEAAPLLGSVTKLANWWSIDVQGRDPVDEAPSGCGWRC